MAWFMLNLGRMKNAIIEPEKPMNHSLHQLFLDELSELYNVEQQLTKALPELVEAAHSDQLKAAIEEHLTETEGHVQRLEEAFQSLGEKPRQKTGMAMQGLVEAATELLQEQQGKPSLDAAIIAAAQKVEHYEIASYGTVLSWAEQMGHTEAASLLSRTLEEEKAADEKLTEYAQSTANLEAAQ
jgi:ferritin-like metal-binding protein YciE